LQPRVAAIDIGTNSVLLLIAEARAGELVPLVERATITRLGEGVDRSGVLAEAACRRTLSCLEDYARELRACAVDRLDVVATSAMRDARGGEAFLRDAASRLGVLPRVISGDEEARLTFEGALSALELKGRVVVCDVGGGSTEIVIGSARGKERVLDSAVSLDIGSVRLFERHVESDPPEPRSLASAAADVRRALESVPAPAAASLVGVAGTITTLYAIEIGLSRYDAARVHGARLSRHAVETLCARLASLPLVERRQLAGLEPGRADVIVTGAVLVLELMRWAGAGELVVSDRGVRWGLATRLTASL
jgi:exopolyphosphatase / guanosine-5'-triphosphate,3'-diphosphate pyrophosphatase